MAYRGTGLLADAGVLAACFGALTLTGTASATAAAAVIVYRVAGCWAGGAGTAVAAALARRFPGGPGRDVSYEPDGPPP